MSSLIRLVPVLCAGFLAADLHAAAAVVADGGLGGMLDITDHRVEVTVDNGIATTRVTQVFRNREDRTIEALWTFPVPKAASVSNFSMWIGGKEMVGEVVEKQRARQIYESYKQTRKDPGLLEQTDHKTFELRIFPIAARAEQRVEMVYQQELDIDHDWATYVYPLAMADGRAQAGNRTAGALGFTFAARSAIPISEIACPSHGEQVVFTKPDPGVREGSLEVRDGDLGRDVVIAYRTERARTGVDLVAAKDGAGDGHFLLTVTAGADAAASNPPQDHVFLLDVSGSMVDDRKLATSKRSLAAFIDALGPEDRCELIVFNSEARRLFGKLTAADGKALEQARAFLERQEARGGTVLAPAMRLAYGYAQADRMLNVIILSDGLTEQRERAELTRLIGERPRNSRVFCIGIGNDVNRPLLDQLAGDSGGLAAFISQGDDFARQAQAFKRKLEKPAARDLRLAIEGVQVYDLEPQRLPDLYHGTPLRVYGRYKGSGSAKVALDGTILGREIRAVSPVEFPAQGSQPAVERMWAWHRIQGLQREADRQGGDRSAVIPEIVRLGEGYSIVSEYTSFLVLENDGEFQRWALQRRNLVRYAKDRAALDQVRTDLARLRDRAAQDAPVELAAAPAAAPARPQPAAPAP
ncbi:MAG: VIT and VWA domain-containing protein, partial [Planctomycetes bacterium]|nr:VIT and VWA domain-containing protein [Planctomycetota bacterium]